MDRENPVLPTPKPRVSSAEKRPTGQDIAAAFEVLSEEKPHLIRVGSPDKSEIVNSEGKIILTFDGTRKGLRRAIFRYQFRFLLNDNKG